MNLSAYLQMTVTPLSRYEPEREHVKKRALPQKAKEAFDAKNLTARMKTVEKYRAVMKDRWMRIPDVQREMNRAEGTVLEVFKRWYQLGMMERRNYGGGEYSRKLGYEWRLK